MQYLAPLLIASLVGCGSATDVNAPVSAEPGGVDGQLALELVGDGARVRGRTVLQTTQPFSAPVSVALRWVIEESLYPSPRTTGTVSLDDGDGAGEFTLTANEPPPADALVANEATGREGVAVAYLMAYVDTDDDGLLCAYREDCSGDRVVGAAPNALVVYADEAWPLDGEPLFAFNGAAGVRPPAGWSLVHLEPQGCEARPTARAWANDDAIELVVIGDFAELERCQVRAVFTDVD
jgi:hypothetical protein